MVGRVDRGPQEGIVSRAKDRFKTGLAGHNTGIQVAKDISHIYQLGLGYVLKHGTPEGPVEQDLRDPEYVRVGFRTPSLELPAHEGSLQISGLHLRYPIGNTALQPDLTVSPDRGLVVVSTIFSATDVNEYPYKEYYELMTVSGRLTDGQVTKAWQLRNSGSPDTVDNPSPEDVTEVLSTLNEAVNVFNRVDLDKTPPGLNSSN